jgi:hypothetical protein
MRMRWSVAVIFGTALAATAASAQRYGTAGAATRYSLLGAETVPTGQDVASAEVGWPGVSFGLTHGYTPRSDIGIKFDLLYGYEFTTTNSQFGIGVRVPLRYQAYRRDRIGVLLHVDPGIKLYTTSPAQFGFQFPVGATIGYTATPEVNVAFGLELPMFLDFTGPGSVQMILGPLFGPAVEYHVDRQLSVGVNTRFGPIFSTRGNGSAFGMIMQLLLAYRM